MESKAAGPVLASSAVACCHSMCLLMPRACFVDGVLAQQHCSRLVPPEDKCPSKVGLTEVVKPGLSGVVSKLHARLCLMLLPHRLSPWMRLA